MGADHQQERLWRTEAARWFLAGFIEGEGALCVGIKQHPTTRSGFHVHPEFFLYQHVSGRRLLELAQAIFQAGSIYSKSGNPSVLVYAVTSRQVIVTRVVPFFERYVLPFTCKRETLIRFGEIVELMRAKEHHTPRGLVRIVEKAYAMNPAHKGRKRLRPLEQVRKRILRDCTPDPHASHEA